MSHPGERALEAHLHSIGEEVTDPSEEAFFLFSQDFPQNNLGMFDEKSPVVTIEVAGRDYLIKQSSGILTSSRAGGTTGAVLWKVTPLLADWLADRNNCLWERGVLHKDGVVVELGSGVAGLNGMVLAPSLSKFILTDQQYVMKLLRENIEANCSFQRAKGTHSRRSAKQLPIDNRQVQPQTFSLDWEQDSATTLKQILEPGQDVDLVLLCDCVYNNFLIKHLTQTCFDICSLNPHKQTLLLIAQQLRTDDVFEEWTSALMTCFRVWRLVDEHLPRSLKNSSGYAIHLAKLKD